MSNFLEDGNGNGNMEAFEVSNVGALATFLKAEDQERGMGSSTSVPGGSKIVVTYDGDKIGELKPSSNSIWYRDSRTLVNGDSQIRILDPEYTGVSLFAATTSEISKYTGEEENRFPEANYILNISPVG